MAGTFLYLSVLVGIAVAHHYEPTKLEKSEDVNLSLHLLPSNVTANSYVRTIQCDFPDDKNLMSEIVEMTILTSVPCGSNNFEEMVSIDMFSNTPKLHLHSDDHTVTVAGLISDDLSAESSLSLSYDASNGHMGCFYKCLVSGRDATQAKAPVVKYGQIEALSSSMLWYLEVIPHYFVSELYSGSVYLASKVPDNEKLDISKRNDRCIQLGGYLAEIDDDLEFSHVREFLNRINQPHGFVIGANDILNEGQFIQYQSGKPFPNLSSWWNPNQPDGDRTENCVEFRLQMDSLLNDLPCDSSNQGTVCEIPYPPIVAK